MSTRAIALGIRQPEVDADLRALLRAVQPWALILFREACVAPAQTRRLCADLREACGRDAVIWIDQEGGRVARLKPPAWPVWPACAAYGALHEKDNAAGIEAARLGHRLIAHELRALGVSADFAPVLDVPVSGSDPIIGDRAFSSDPAVITALGRAALEGLADGGVLGCIKHMPGHGRADQDSHLALPRVRASRAELAADFAPFRALSGALAAMTAHIVYEALDPERPATHSLTVIKDTIRADLGFDGLLLSDDLDMKALEGGLRTKAEKAFAAGCDLVLQCNGVIADMDAAAQGSPILSGRALERAGKAEAAAGAAPSAFDAATGWWRFRQLMGPNIRAGV